MNISHLYIHSTVTGHLGFSRFWLLEIILLWTFFYMSFSAHMYAMLTWKCNYSRYCQRIFPYGYSNLYFRSRTSESVALHLSQHLVCQFLLVLAILGWRFNLHFLSWLMTLSTFLRACWPFGSPLLWSSYFFLIKNGLSVFSVLVCHNSLYILHTNCLLIHVWHISSPFTVYSVECY